MIFLPYVKGIPEEIANKAKYMVVSLPSNPVGSIATPGLYEEIVEFAKKYDILIIHDNAYSDIIFDGAFGGSFLATPGAKDIGVEFFSLSKSFNVTGARLSFLVGRPDVIAALRKLRSQIDFGMFLPLQKAAIAALQGPLDSVKDSVRSTRREEMLSARDFVISDGNFQIGKGTMFVWAKIPGWPHRQHGILYGTDGKGRRHRDSGSKLSVPTERATYVSPWYFRRRRSGKQWKRYRKSGIKLNN